MTFQHVQGKANKATDALSRLLHNPEMTPQQTYSHSSLEEEDYLNVKIEYINSNAELGKSKY